MSHPWHRQVDVVLRDGSSVHVRPVRATDAPFVRAFFERLSPKSITLRFFSSAATGNVCPDGASVSRSQHGGGAHEPHSR
jgi:hypothetical protein